MKTNKKTLHITQLRLDRENPKHDILENQNEIIHQLIESEQIENLAKDIAKYGSLSPLEIVGVLRSDNDKETEGFVRVCY